MIPVASPYRYVGVVFRLALAAVFLIAGGSKIPHPWVFVHTVEGYKMLPDSLARPFGLALPWIEVLIGIYLLVGLFTRIVAAASAAVLVLFLVALGVQIVHGNTSNCGCVVGIDNPVITWFIGGNNIGPFDLVRDGVLLLMSVVVAALPAPALAVDSILAARRGERDAYAGYDEDPVVA